MPEGGVGGKTPTREELEANQDFPKPNRNSAKPKNKAPIRKALGIPTPYNEALTALLKGREFADWRRINEPDTDYDALEARAQHESMPSHG